MRNNRINRLCRLLLTIGPILLVMLFASCKTKDTIIKTNTESKTNVSENTTNRIDRQINIQTTENLKESQSKEWQLYQFEDLSITQKTIKYDTDKPIDPTTGKHPVKEETVTTINQQTKEESKQSEQSLKEESGIKTIQQRVQQLKKSNTRSSLRYATKNETKEKDGLSTIQKGLIALGLLFLGGLGFSIYKLIKKKKVDFYR